MARLQSFPLLSAAEFQQGCSDLCNRLSAGRLQASLTHEHGERFMILKRRLEVGVHARENTARWLPAEDEKEDGDNDDEEEFRDILSSSRSYWTVEYHILLSPTYQVPVLYLQLLDNGIPASLADVYDLLVDPAVHGHVQNVGVQGAISQADHPVRGVPYYFVHPCATAATMAGWDGDDEMGPAEYLMAWVGVIGPAVGLYLPVCTAVTDANIRTDDG